MEVYDRDRELRVTIIDGEVRDLQGKVHGFVEPNGACGNADQQFMGEINDSGQVLNDRDEHIGTVDDSNGSFRDQYGSFLGQIKPGGDIVDALDGHRGKIDGFDYNQFRAIAAYIFFFDRALVEDGAASIITGDQPSGNSEATLSLPTSAPQHEEINLSLDLPLPPMPGKSQTQQHEETLSIDLALPPMTLNLPPLHAHSPTAAPPSVIAVDLALPKPEPALQAVNLTLPASAPAPVAHLSPRIEKRQYKTYQVGAFKTLPGGKNSLEITDCDVEPHQLSVRVEKKGEQLVFQRTIMDGDTKKEQIQRFSLPYSVTEDRVEATYARHVEGGKLSMTLTKPAGLAQSGPVSGQFCSFEVPANPSADSAARVSFGTSQGADHFQFDLKGESKWNTEVVGELEGGSTVMFHCTVVNTEERVRKKGTQTISLPISVTLDNIETTGTSIKIWKNKTVSATAPAAAVPTTEPKDCDIKIKIL